MCNLGCGCMDFLYLQISLQIINSIVINTVPIWQGWWGGNQLLIILPGTPFHIKIILTKEIIRPTNVRTSIYFYSIWNTWIALTNIIYAFFWFTKVQVKNPQVFITMDSLGASLHPAPFPRDSYSVWKYSEDQIIFLEELWTDGEQTMQYITFEKRELGIFERCTQWDHFTLGSEPLLASGFGVTWMEDYRKWYLRILSTEFSEPRALNKVRPSSINSWCRHEDHSSGHKILELPEPDDNKITIREFIKYLLDTWKTKHFVRDHRTW